jgi:hypothetical protein
LPTNCSARGHSHIVDIVGGLRGARQQLRQESAERVVKHRVHHDVLTGSEICQRTHRASNLRLVGGGQERLAHARHEAAFKGD